MITEIIAEIVSKRKPLYTDYIIMQPGSELVTINGLKVCNSQAYEGDAWNNEVGSIDPQIIYSGELYILEQPTELIDVLFEIKSQYFSLLDLGKTHYLTFPCGQKFIFTASEDSITISTSLAGDLTFSFEH